MMTPRGGDHGHLRIPRVDTHTDPLRCQLSGLVLQGEPGMGSVPQMAQVL